MNHNLAVFTEATSKTESNRIRHEVKGCLEALQTLFFIEDRGRLVKPSPTLLRTRALCIEKMERILLALQQQSSQEKGNIT